MNSSKPLECDLLVIGRGLAGMASALFAASRGISTAQVGAIGGMLFASGLFDLLGVHPIEEQKCWRDPWAAIEALKQDLPNHPYARVVRTSIEEAFKEVLSFLAEAGLLYMRRKNRNSFVMTPLGTVKPTYCVPRTMWAGVKAFEEKAPCLIVSFQGLNDFSGHQIAATLRESWPALRAIQVPFPHADLVSELVTGEIMAQSLELSNNRDTLAQGILPHVKNAKAIGMPAVLGVDRCNEVISDMEEKTGVPVFEIPTLPVSVSGLRLYNTLSRHLMLKGVRHFPQSRALEVSQPNGRDFVVKIGSKIPHNTITAKGIVLASGRFWSRGLLTDRKHIRESIFDLPVYQLGERKNWHRKDFLDRRGHPVNQAGLEVDDSFRPVDASGRVPYENLFAAGSILAHQDWMRMKCGAGLAITTAYAAVNSFLKVR